jgi:hypothetical protein
MLISATGFKPILRKKPATDYTENLCNPWLAAVLNTSSENLAQPRESAWELSQVKFPGLVLAPFQARFREWAAELSPARFPDAVRLPEWVAELSAAPLLESVFDTDQVRLPESDRSPAQPQVSVLTPAQLQGLVLIPARLLESVSIPAQPQESVARARFPELVGPVGPACCVVVQFAVYS